MSTMAKRTGPHSTQIESIGRRAAPLTVWDARRIVRLAVSVGFAVCVQVTVVFVVVVVEGGRCEVRTRRRLRMVWGVLSEMSERKVLFFWVLVLEDVACGRVE